jgi:hypothetical protein
MGQMSELEQLHFRSKIMSFSMKRVIIESPYAAPNGMSASDAFEVLVENVRYARAALADSLKRGEAPLASHLLYTQPGVLDDSIPEERAKGIAAGYEHWAANVPVVFYVDRGFSNGMLAALERAVALAAKIEIRRIEGWK